MEKKLLHEPEPQPIGAANTNDKKYPLYDLVDLHGGGKRGVWLTFVLRAWSFIQGVFFNSDNVRQIRC
jgi:hypothetical protein